VFVDLAGLTALTEAMGDLEAANLAHDFHPPYQTSPRRTKCTWSS
jgi:hypothetical protein